jgi:AraC-like DNA-binding protein
MIQSVRPHPDLKDIIKEYYLIEKKLDEVKMKIPIVDDCCHDIVFFKERKANLQYGPGENIAPIEAKIFTILGLDPPYILKVENNLTFFTIKFQPWMNRYFFKNLDPNGIVNLEDYNASLMTIYDQLKEGLAIKQLVESANDIFLAQEIALTPKMNFTKALCEFIMTKDGLVKVTDIANQFNKSRQYINKTFRQEVMCSLKTFITAVKIMALVKQKAKSGDVSLTQLSYDYGYFDQAHFINDFKKVCGVTPGYYFENLPEFILRHQ